jgi:predicted transcriptional regulator
METKVLTAHVPLPLAENIDEWAARLDRPRGWIMKQALQHWVNQLESGAATGFAEAQAAFTYGSKDTGIDAAKAVDALKSLRKATTLGDISWQDLRDTGRR